MIIKFMNPTNLSQTAKEAHFNNQEIQMNLACNRTQVLIDLHFKILYSIDANLYQ